MRYWWIVMGALLLAACAQLDLAVESGRQAVETGRQVLETGRQVLEAGKQLANSEIARQLQSFLKEKYESSAALREAMFSGDGELLAEELERTELANFTFYRSEFLDVEFRGKLTADGTFQVLRYHLSQPDGEPAIIGEFNAFLDKNGEIQVDSTAELDTVGRAHGGGGSDEANGAGEAAGTGAQTE